MRLRRKLQDHDLWPECAICGCTDAEGCLGGCTWVPPITSLDRLICSSCRE